MRLVADFTQQKPCKPEVESGKVIFKVLGGNKKKSQEYFTWQSCLLEI